MSAQATVTEVSNEDTLPRPIGDIDLERKAKELGIKNFYLSFTSLALGQRLLVVPASAIKRAQTKGCNYHGFMDYGTGAMEPECYFVPDPTTLIQLPWKPEWGWLSCFVYLKGKPLPECPRRALVKQVERARRLGYVFKTGIEPEFILYKKNSLNVNDPSDQSMFTMLPTVRTSGFMSRITEAMDSLGWGPYKFEHKAVSNQYEIGFDYADALTTADRWSFMKFMIKALADEEGLRASFMPKATYRGRLSEMGNGLHIHFSMWSADKDKQLVPEEGSDLGLSDIGRQFLAGVITHLKSMALLYCSTVNSYKRLHARKNRFYLIGYGIDSRYPAIRIVTENGLSNRFELRPNDAAANPYLAHAGLLASGLDGIHKKLVPDPKQQIEEDLSLSPPLEYIGWEVMSKNLSDAVKEFEANPLTKEVFGEHFVQKLIERKQDHWDTYMHQFEHEAASNQYEIGFDYADVLTTADRWSFMKFMIKALADEEGLRASFMPKATYEGSLFELGNGLHIHFSMWSVDKDKQVFPEEGSDLGLSDIGRQFLAGVMANLKSMTLLYCSTVNSYKRLHSMKNWLYLVGYGIDSRYPAIRIVTENGLSNRFELRSSDAAANPYLAHAGLLASGLDGIDKKLVPDPKQRIEEELFLSPPLEYTGFEVMPKNLSDAVKEFEANPLSKEVFGEHFVRKLVERKQDHWDTYMHQVSEWERSLCDAY